MGSMLRARLRVFVRPLLLSALVAVAWLVWGADTAGAAPACPGPVVLSEHDDVPSLQDATVGSASAVLAEPVSAVAAPLASAQQNEVQAIPTAPPLEAVPLESVASRVAPTVISTTGGLQDPSAIPATQVVPLPVATTTVATAMDAADAVLNEATEAVATVASPATPVLTGAAEVVHTVVGTVPLSVPDVPLPTIPLPLPEPVGQMINPVINQVTNPHAGKDAPLLPAPTAGHAKTADHAKAAVDARSEDPRATASAWPSSAHGLSPARVRLIAPAVHALAVTARPAGSSASPPAKPKDDEQLHRLAALQSRSGSVSSGSGGIGAQASADLTGSWSPQQADRTARTPDATQRLAANPSFDPGSSPD